MTAQAEQGYQFLKNDTKVYLTINCVNKENKLKKEDEKGGCNIAAAIRIYSVGYMEP